MTTLLFKIHNLKPGEPGISERISDLTTDLKTEESGFDFRQGRIVLCYLTVQTSLGAN